MKNTAHLLCVVAAKVICGFSFSPAAWSEVIPAKFTAIGQTRHKVYTNRNPNSVLTCGQCSYIACAVRYRSIMIDSSALINLAMGNQRTAQVPANLRLVVVDPCEESPRLAIWNSITSNVVATIAYLDTAALVNNLHVGHSCNWHTTQAIKHLSMEFDPVGTDANAIISGSVSLFAHQDVDTPLFTEEGGCVRSMDATGVGQMTIRRSDPPYGNNNVALILFRRVSLQLSRSTDLGQPVP